MKIAHFVDPSLIPTIQPKKAHSQTKSTKSFHLNVLHIENLELTELSQVLGT